MHPELTSDAWPAFSRRQSLTDCLAWFLEDWPSLRHSREWPIAVDLASAVEAQGCSAAIRNEELAFHNREHIFDVLSGLYCLCRYSPDTLSISDVSVLLIAMIGHDFLHNGEANQSLRERERVSCTSIEPFLSRLEPHLRRQIVHLILSTDPAGYGRLMRDLDTSAQRRARLAVDADLFASLLPLRGFYLGNCLADEIFPSDVKSANSLRTLQGRYSFLQSYSPRSSAACSLGLPGLVAAQLDVILSLTPEERRRPWSDSWGHVFADQVRRQLKK
ncbi:MAG: 35-cyclic nucleotide phosphodiesterase [Pseudomonadota bacterium]|jgi:hypothetical protein